MLTVKKVNAEIKNRGIAAVLMKGRGYFYFLGPDVDLAASKMVCVYSLNELTLEGWMKELDRIIENAR